jgi:pyruvate/2-oxoglutarate dehydrogenase complex dihydrolipoamide acyltransferase (E2) component
MAVELKMPQLGESVHEGTIGRWLKQEGDAVAKYDPVLEVITDKVDTEITAVEGGTLLKILVPEGETVKVGTPLALIGAAGEAPAASAPTVAAEAAPPVAPPVAAVAATAPSGEPSTAIRVSPVAARVAAEHGIDPGEVPASGRSGQVTRGDVEQFVAARAVAAPQASQAPVRALGFISPRVARLAAEHGVDLSQIDGSGREGRITARDVEVFVAARAATEAAPAPALASAAPVSAAPAAAGPGLGELVAHTSMRRAIAEHMVHSKQTSPHVTTVHEVDMGAVMAANAALKADYAARGIKLTLTAFMMQCLAEAIRRHPLVNSSWTDAGIQIHPSVNIGMAVALPGGGLIVPVIKQADEKNLAGMAKAVGDLAGRARDRKLVPDDVKGGTFTVTNYGTLGSLFGTPVINQPQTAILGTGAIKKRVVVVESPAGDSIAIRPIMLLALTFDHRVLDGGTADPFMQTLVRLLESYRV